MGRGQPLPLERYRLSFSSDGDGIRKVLRRAMEWDVRAFDIQASAASPRLRCRRLIATVVPCLELGAATNLTCRPAPQWQNMMTPLVSAVNVRIGSDDFLLSAWKVLVVPQVDHVSMRLAANEQLSVLQARRDTLELLLGGKVETSPDEPLRFETLMDVTGGPNMSVYEMWLFMLRELNRRGALIEFPNRAEQFEMSVLSMLLDVQPHDYTSRLVNGVAGGASGCGDVPHPERLRPGLKSVLDFIERSPELEHSTASLAEYAGVSPRTIQNWFTERFGVPPMQYIRNVRLDRVYAALLKAPPDGTTVTEVAGWMGFQDQRSLRKSYRQRFNELPSHTLQRARPSEDVPQRAWAAGMKLASSQDMRVATMNSVVARPTCAAVLSAARTTRGSCHRGLRSHRMTI